LCTRTDARKRIIQQIVAETADAYIASLNSHSQEVDACTTRASTFQAKGLVIDTHCGDVKMSTRRVLQEIVQFFAVWAYIVITVFLAVFRKDKAVLSPCTILLEPGGDWKTSDAKFADFCTRGPVTALTSASRIVVCAASAPLIQSDERISYARYPILHIVERGLERTDRLIALWRCFIAPFIFYKSIVSNRLAALLAREIAILPLVQFLDQIGRIEAVVATTSSFGTQPIWMKGIAQQKFRCHMVWYSQNFVPKIYRGETMAAPLPQARHMRIDVHWVWTEGFRDYLRGMKQVGDIYVVGPILWYLPEIPESNPVGLDIAIFDVTPLPEGVQAFGSYKNYYSPSTMKKFILDVVSVCQQLEMKKQKKIRVLLKHKRPPVSGRHDQGYLDFIDSLHEQYQNFLLLPEHANLFQVLTTTIASVSVPYTSTCYVAASLKKQAIYYDPYGELEPLFEPSPYVHFSGDRETLCSLIEAAIDRQLSCHSA